MGDRIDELLKGFYDFRESMEKRMDNLDQRMDNLDQRMNSLEKRMDTQEKRFENFVKLSERSFASLIEDNKKIYKKLEEHDEKFHQIESKIFTIKRMATENSLEISNIKSGIV